MVPTDSLIETRADETEFLFNDCLFHLTTEVRHDVIEQHVFSSIGTKPS
jgi:hypothetical protein